MNAVNTLLHEGIDKWEMAQSFEDNYERRNQINQLIKLAWEIINTGNEKPPDSSGSGD